MKSSKTTYVISYFLGLVIYIEGPLISDGTFIGTAEYKNPNYIKTHEYKVFVYGDTVVKAHNKIEFKLSVTIQPRLINTVIEIIELFNQKIKQELVKKLGNHFDNTNQV